MALLRHSTCAAHFWHPAATAASTAPTAPADVHTTATTASTTAPTAHADPTRTSTRGKLAERLCFVLARPSASEHQPTTDCAHRPWLTLCCASDAWVGYPGRTPASYCLLVAGCSGCWFFLIHPTRVRSLVCILGFSGFCCCALAVPVIARGGVHLTAPGITQVAIR